MTGVYTYTYEYVRRDLDGWRRLISQRLSAKISVYKVLNLLMHLVLRKSITNFPGPDNFKLYPNAVFLLDTPTVYQIICIFHGNYFATLIYIAYVCMYV